MNLYQGIKNKEKKISVIGLGYVGLPLAVAFAKKATVVGFDIQEEKIEKYKKGIDITGEVGDEEVLNSEAFFTHSEKELRNCQFHIVAVPTPISSDKTPDLKPVIRASESLGRNLTKGSYVVYESTVYPGVTEDICVPILEKMSGLSYGTDFKVGYSPERINPGDKTNRLENIVKIVSGMDGESLDIISSVYEMIIEAGVYKAASIRVAEAAKVIENAQRDINIAFMNELSMVFNIMDIDTQAVLEAAGTKWNFLNFSPGLVGGHCIGVDPYYFIYRAEELGYHSQIVMAARRINDEMGKHVVQNMLKCMIKAGKQIKDTKIAIFGITFKENVPDCRNSKVIDIYRELKEYGINVLVFDPVADEEEVKREYGIDLSCEKKLQDLDGIIFAVKHHEFENLSLIDVKKMYKASDRYVLIDVKGNFNRQESENLGFIYWRL